MTSLPGFLKKNPPIPGKDFYAEVASKQGLSQPATLSYLEISKRIQPNKEGGLGAVGAAESTTTLVKGNTPTNINITIDNLVKEFTIETTNLTSATMAQVESMVAKALVSAVNDPNQTPGK